MFSGLNPLSNLPLAWVGLAETFDSYRRLLKRLILIF